MTDDNNKDSKEKVYYDEGNVKITNSRAILDNKTYVLKNISSVTVNTIEHKAIKFSGLLEYFIGAVFLLTFVGSLISGQYSESITTSLIYFGLGGACCYYAYSKSKKNIPAWETPARDEYSVRIGSNAGETDGLISEDKDYITKIVNAINDAIIEN